MRKIFLTALAAMCAGAAWAAPVTVDRAKATAAAFFKSMTGRDASVKETVSQNDTYYIFNMTRGGWVIVSADDTATPVLGYNTSGSMTWHNMPSGMLGMLDSYKGEINAIRRAGIRTVNSGWSVVTSGVRQMSRAAGTIDPLIQVSWNQGNPFNKYTPGSGNTKTLVGCVAVAMSQAMSVQRYPLQPQGSKSYLCAGYGQISVNYDAEKTYSWDNIISGANNFDEAARLMYHAGVSVEMDYGTDGSGIPSNRVDRIPAALADNFGYNAADLRYTWRSGYSGDWESLILNELNAGRAVVYNAADSKGNYGHSFNVDGYNGNHMFHLNWGWGGVGDGYFTLDNLADASMDMNYDTGHVVVTGIGSPDQVFKSIELSDIIIDEKLPAGTVVGQITVNGEAPQSGYTLEIFGPYNAQTNKFEDVPFEIDGDLLVSKSVLTARSEPYEVNIRVIDRKTNSRLTSTFNITVCPLRTIAQATSLKFDRQSGEILIKTRNGVQYTLADSKGVQLASGTLSPVPHLTLSLADLPSGDNVLTLSAGGESKKLVIKNK